jgi:hypothetical protein
VWRKRERYMKPGKGKQKRRTKKKIWVAGKLIKLIADRNSFSKKRERKKTPKKGKGMNGNYCMQTFLMKSL